MQDRQQLHQALADHQAKKEPPQTDPQPRPVLPLVPVPPQAVSLDFDEPLLPFPYTLCKGDEEERRNKMKPNQVRRILIIHLLNLYLQKISSRSKQVGTVFLYGIRIVSLGMDGKERLCLAQISNTLLKDYSYNEIHNRRVALGITCVQCTPVQVSN